MTCARSQTFIELAGMELRSRSAILGPSKPRAKKGRKLRMRLPLAALFTFLALALGTASAAVASDSPTSVPAAPSVCSERRSLTTDERQAVLLFRNRLMRLDEQRRSQPGPSFEARLARIVDAHEGTFTSHRAQEAAANHVLVAQLKEALHQTIGLQLPEVDRLIRVIDNDLVFAGTSQRPLTRAVLGVQKKIWEWMSREVRAGDSHEAALRLSEIARAESALGLLDLVHRSVLTVASQNLERLNDQLSFYKQFGITLLGGGVAGATLVASAPVVAASSAVLSTAGMVLAGCAIGSAGGGSASLLQRQYVVYSDAYLASVRNQTAFSCELRERLGSDSGGLLAALTKGMINGAIAGCAMSASALVRPAFTAYSVVGAVALATGIEGTRAAREAYFATRSYMIYRSLLAYQKAELSVQVGNPVVAQAALEEAREHARAAGAHLLNSILAGVVLVGMRSEMQHSLAAGRQAILSLVAKSSDNAAVAVHILREEIQ